MTDPFVIQSISGSNFVKPPVPDRNYVQCSRKACGNTFYAVVENA